MSGNEMPKIIECTWDDYNRFMELCCVATFPFSRGKCWRLVGDEGFIGYNWGPKNGIHRPLAFPGYQDMNMKARLDWLNENVRCLSRVMVRPEYRGLGYAKHLICETVDKVGVDYIECITFSKSIAGLLLKCGFERIIAPDEGDFTYFLWSRLDCDR